MKTIGGSNQVPEQEEQTPDLSAASISATAKKELDDILASIPMTSIDESFSGAQVEGEHEVERTDKTMTSVDPAFAAGHGMTAASKIRRKGKDSFEDSRDVRPATEVDLENLDESMIMNMPHIKAAAFEISSILNLRPKDKSLRFRWANYKNHVAGNLARLLSLGYSVASIDDVDIDKSKVDPSMLDGTQVKYYDVILLKIPVMRLMALYKSNILSSVMRLANSQQQGVAEANRQFNSDINAEGQGRAYSVEKAKLGGRNPVEFFTPGA